MRDRRREGRKGRKILEQEKRKGSTYMRGKKKEWGLIRGREGGNTEEKEGK